MHPLGLFLAVVILIGSQFAEAQQTQVPLPAPPEVASNPTTTSPPPASAPNGPITVNLPNPIKIEATSVGSSGGWLSGLLTLLGVLVTAGVSGWIGYATAKGGELTRKLTERLALEEHQIKLSLAKLDLNAKQDQFNREQA